MSSFTSLGIDVAVTELEFRIPVPPTPTNDKKQAPDHYSTIRACVNVERCMGVTVWNFVDTYSWVPKSFGGVYGSAHMWAQPNGAQPNGNRTDLVRKEGLFEVVL